MGGLGDGREALGGVEGHFTAVSSVQWVRVGRGPHITFHHHVQHITSISLQCCVLQWGRILFGGLGLTLSSSEMKCSQRGANPPKTEMKMMQMMAHILNLFVESLVCVLPWLETSEGKTIP